MPIYAAIYDGPPENFTNRVSAKRYIAIHNTSNDATAEAEASYAKRRTDDVSSHYYVDAHNLIQSLNTDYRAWHAGSTQGNDRAIAYEITGTNGKSRAWWLANVAWDLLAAQIAVDCKRWAITPQGLTVSEIKAGAKTGVITHDQMRQAWGGTTHTDPGPGFPMDHLLALVRAKLEEGDGDMSAESEKQIKDLHYAMFTNDLPNRPDGSQSHDGKATRALAEAIQAEQKVQAAAIAKLAVSVAALAEAVKPLPITVKVTGGELKLGSVDGATPA